MNVKKEGQPSFWNRCTLRPREGKSKGSKGTQLARVGDRGNLRAVPLSSQTSVTGNWARQTSPGPSPSPSFSPPPRPGPRVGGPWGAHQRSDQVLGTCARGTACRLALGAAYCRGIPCCTCMNSCRSCLYVLVVSWSQRGRPVSCLFSFLPVSFLPVSRGHLSPFVSNGVGVGNAHTGAFAVPT